MQPFLTKTLLSMLAGSFHLACKVTLTSRREAILPSPLYILPNTTQRYYFVISLKFPSQRGAFCLVWRYAVSCFVPERHTKRRLRPYETATALHKHSRTQKASLSLLFTTKEPVVRQKKTKNPLYNAPEICYTTIATQPHNVHLYSLQKFAFYHW